MYIVSHNIFHTCMYTLFTGYSNPDDATIHRYFFHMNTDMIEFHALFSFLDSVGYWRATYICYYFFMFNSFHYSYIIIAQNILAGIHKYGSSQTYGLDFWSMDYEKNKFEIAYFAPPLFV